MANALFWNGSGMNIRRLTPETSLMKSGLLGPVRLLGAAPAATGG